MAGKQRKWIESQAKAKRQEKRLAKRQRQELKAHRRAERKGTS